MRLLWLVALDLQPVNSGNYLVAEFVSERAASALLPVMLVPNSARGTVLPGPVLQFRYDPGLSRLLP